MASDNVNLNTNPFASAEDRALRGRNPSADWSLQTAEGPDGPHHEGNSGLILLLEREQGDESTSPKPADTRN